MQPVYAITLKMRPFNRSKSAENASIIEQPLLPIKKVSFFNCFLANYKFETGSRGSIGQPVSRITRISGHRFPAFGILFKNLLSCRVVCCFVFREIV